MVLVTALVIALVIALALAIALALVIALASLMKVPNHIRIGVNIRYNIIPVYKSVEESDNLLFIYIAHCHSYNYMLIC